MQGVGLRGGRSCRGGGQTRGIVCTGRGREEAGRAGEWGGGGGEMQGVKSIMYGAPITILKYTMQNILSYFR